MRTKNTVGEINIAASLGGGSDIELTKKSLHFLTEEELYSFLDKLDLFLNKEIAKFNNCGDKEESDRVRLYEDILG